MKSILTWSDLSAWRKHPSRKLPRPHQQKAIDKLRGWYDAKPCPPRGGILVLPTDGGKTFTALHFICRRPLTDGYKVLWLAHTHHLLEQAAFSLEDLLPCIGEPKNELRVRVVSGAIGHCKVAQIQTSDDMVIASLQTISNALRNNHEHLNRFLQAASGKLVVVFDEAHHSPAPSYHRLVGHLRDICPDLYLLGMTATPVYTDPRRAGLLAEVFPQDILFQTTPQELMAAGVLAKPILNHRARSCSCPDAG